MKTKKMRNKKGKRRGLDYIGVGVGAVILNKEGKFFLAKRGPKANNEPGTWEFPGGGMEFGETMAQTVKREVREEFGITIMPLRPLNPIDHIIPKEKQHWIAIPYVAKLIRGTPRILEVEKCDQIGWFSLEEIEKLNLSSAARNASKEIKEKYGEISDFF